MALIEVADVTKTFAMGAEKVNALAGVSLRIEQGELAAIIGPSGSGKSTLMNILGLLDNPTSGSYRLEGRAAEKLRDDERASLRNQKIGFVFQSFNLLPRLSALRNVEMPLVYASSYGKGYTPAQMRERAREALDRVKLAHRMSHAPNELSGGERQRVAIARALVNRPSIVFADEPTGNLDSRVGQQILELFEQLNRDGTTLVIVTHDPTVAARTRHVISMLDGRVKEDRVHARA
jgi:putative ABC transport system ATP-binding protein